MTFPELLSGCLLAVLIGSAQYARADHPSGDVVTLKNGNIYIGRVDQVVFDLDTRLGHLAIPALTSQGLHTLSGKRQVRIETTSGERLTGRLMTEDIRVSRLQDPTLPIALEDIASIDFGHQDQRSLDTDYPSQLETTDGDIYRVRLRQETLSLQNNTTNQSIATSTLHYLDVSFNTYEEKVLAQATLLGGGILQGKLSGAQLELASPYLDTMSVPDKAISRLVIDLQPASTPSSAAIFSDSMRTLGDGPEMVRIKGGSFLRGDHQGDGDDDEHPMAEVKLNDFAIGRYEITFKQYDLFCRQTRRQLPDDQEWGRNRRPVINVSWEDAHAYVEWLARKTGKPYRLPSDAEWEYASRAGGTTRYPWGDSPGLARANCEGCGSIWDGDQTAPVGRFQANAFGLYDTTGNVFEWVEDCFHDRFADAPADGSPIEKEGCGKRVIRGGAWSFPPKEIRSANRWRDFPTRRSDDTGFRVAMDLQ